MMAREQTARIGRRIAAGAVGGVLLSLGTVFAGEPGESPGRKYSTLERMRPERLAAQQADVAAIQASRVGVERETGYTDFRAIFHAHAEDATHTGGTLPEMLRDAQRAGVSVIFLSNHYRPPRDFIEDNWRGLKEGVLFIPGAETTTSNTNSGLLLHPMESVMEQMEGPLDELLAAVEAGRGMAFLCHVEERVDHSLDGLTGMEIYNRHADTKDDMAVMLPILGALTDPARYESMKTALETYPDEMLAVQLDYPTLYMDKWDAETRSRRVVGVAANDCHHNQVFITKKVDEDTVLLGTVVDEDDDMRQMTARQYPGIAAMTKGHEPGDVVARLDFDPYYRSFHNVSTHILADALTEAAVRDAVAEGRAYVSHDWMCDPTGFYFAARHVDDSEDAPARALMGAEIGMTAGLELVVEMPVEARVRILRNGDELAVEEGSRVAIPVDRPGVYRAEVWLRVDDELRPWVYTNPIYVRDLD